MRPAFTLRPRRRFAQGRGRIFAAAKRSRRTMRGEQGGSHVNVALSVSGWS
jgi:hypothetical protein